MPQHFDGFDDEQWDEFKWEAHLNEVERKSEQLRKFITSDPKGNVPRWITLLKESQDEDDAFEAYVEEELLMDEAYFPEDEDDWEDEDEDDWDDEDFLFGNAADHFMDMGPDEEDDFDDFEDGDEWKSLSDDYMYSDYSEIDDLGIFVDAKDLAVDVLKWAETIHPKYQTQEFQDFVDETLKIGAKIAGGHSFGFEPEYIGANIAYSKKALKCANHGLELMPLFKKKKLLKTHQYLDLHARLFELRNDIGVYIQELRDQFRLGLD